MFYLNFPVLFVIVLTKEEGQKAKGDILKEEMNLSMSGSIPIFPLMSFQSTSSSGCFYKQFKSSTALKRNHKRFLQKFQMFIYVERTQHQESLATFYNFVYCVSSIYFLVKLQVIYNVVPISAIQQSNSVLHTHTSL